MPNDQSRNMLVTGGAGFIGANFVRYVLANHPAIKIINLDKLTYAGSLDNLKDLPNASQHHFVQGDICDKQLITDLLAQHHIDTIVHFAAESHVDRSIDAPADFIATNIIGTFILLEAARHYWHQTFKLDAAHCRFHHISTDEVFGSLQPTDPAFSETTRYDPSSPYSASKAGSDHLIQAYHRTYGLPVTMTNCSNNYGPYQHAEKFIPTVIHACLNQQPIPIYGNGKNIRDWLYVEDHCSAIMAVLERGKSGESYNVGGNNEWENLTLATYICEQLDSVRPQASSYKDLLQFVTDRAGHDFRYAIDSSKIMQELEWQPKETVESGIQKTIAFYCSLDALCASGKHD